MNLKKDCPIEFFEPLINIQNDSFCLSYIMMDEYVFSTYLSTLIQGIYYEDLIKIIKDVLPEIDEEEFSSENTISKIDRQEKLFRIVDNLKTQFGENITTTYVKDFFICISVYREILRLNSASHNQNKTFQTLVNKIFEYIKDLNTEEISSAITTNLNRLVDVMDLSQDDKHLIEINLLFSTDIRASIFRDFLFLIFKNSSLNEHFYTVMLNSVNKNIKAITNKSLPIALGIINYDTRSKRMSNMSDFWVYIITTYVTSEEEFFSRFTEKLQSSSSSSMFSGVIAKAEEVDEKLIKEFLNKVDDLNNREKEGLNVLLYGPSKLDKTGYIVKLFKENNIKGIKIRTKDAKSFDIPSICYIAQKCIAKMSKDSYESIILVIEKAEQALTKTNKTPDWLIDMISDNNDDIDDGDMISDDILLKNPIPAIWVVNNPSQITSENVGKFLFHMELRSGSRADRREEVKNVINELGFSSDTAMKLSKYVEINIEQVKTAARAVNLLKRDESDREEVLFHLIKNSQKALDREKMEDLRDSITKYSLDFLNLAGNMSIEKIIQALKIRPTGSLCFYGPPGTGKTQLAEFMATELDKPLIIKPASELLNMYLGESEKNIAKMFDEAKMDGAILLLDEADSFLRDRSMASKSWEITQVNELLQKMERFQGIFICATNLFSSLDAAALRRFTFKLEFKPLTKDQRLKMFINETGIDIDSYSSIDRDGLIMDLSLIKHLTPGDFATVRRQAILLGENLDVSTWLDRLEIESKAKLVGLERNGMGFIN